MGIPLESAKSSSDNNFDEPRLPNTTGKSRKSKSSLSAKQSQKKSGRLASDSIGYYLSSIGRVPLLTPAEEIELAHHVQNMKKLLQIPETDRTRRNLYQIKIGKRARDRMMAANLRLVVSVAKKYQNQGLELLDLVQEGAIGLERAVDKFDPAMGYKFSTYAYWWIRQGITRAIAEKSRAIRLPIHITEMLNKLKKGQRELSQEMSRTPTVSELAKYVELPEDDVKDLMCKAGQPVSLETKVGDGEDTVLLDLLAGGEDLPDEQIEMDCMRGDLHSLLHQLPDLQCRVLRMRYGMDGDEPMSLTGIGRVLGISRDRVRNLERDGLRGLRRLSDNVEAYFVS